jgi:hypothetical protein
VECSTSTSEVVQPQVIHQSHYYGTRKLRLPRMSFSCDCQRPPFISPGQSGSPGTRTNIAAGIHPHEKRNLIVVDASYLIAMIIEAHMHAMGGTRRPCDNCLLFVVCFDSSKGRSRRAACSRAMAKYQTAFEFIERCHTGDGDGIRKLSINRQMAMPPAFDERACTLCSSSMTHD